MRGHTPVAQAAADAAAYASAISVFRDVDSPKFQASMFLQLQLSKTRAEASAWASATATSNANAVALEYAQPLAAPPPETSVVQVTAVATVACKHGMPQVTREGRRKGGRRAGFKPSTAFYKDTIGVLGSHVGTATHGHDIPSTLEEHAFTSTCC